MGQSIKEDKADFNISPSDYRIVAKIVSRVEKLLDEKFNEERRMAAEMDICACHLNGCKLDLKKLLNADNDTFSHDISGITSNMDRNTGKLSGHFSPRTSTGESRVNGKS